MANTIDPLHYKIFNKTESFIEVITDMNYDVESVYVYNKIENEDGAIYSRVYVEIKLEPGSKKQGSLKKILVKKIGTPQHFSFYIGVQNARTEEEKLNKTQEFHYDYIWNLFAWRLEKEGIKFTHENFESENSKEIGAIRKLLTTRVVFHNFNAKALNFFAELNIRTVGDLVQVRVDDLLKLKNFGKRNLDEIESFFSEKGLTFGMEVVDKYNVPKWEVHNSR